MDQAKTNFRKKKKEYDCREKCDDDDHDDRDRDPFIFRLFFYQFNKLLK